MRHPVLALYHRLPSTAQSAAATMRGLYLQLWRQGPESDRLAHAALERDTWSPEQWSAWREAQLQAMLQRAATRVPYYREQWTMRRRRGDRASREILENWPLLARDAVLENPLAFVADDCDVRRMFHDRTSGTTGKPLDIWRTRRTLQSLYGMAAARTRMWRGIPRGARWARLGSQAVTPVQRRQPPFWVWNAAMHQLYMSRHHLSPDLVPYYLDALARYRVIYLAGYPSALAELAREALRQQRTDLRMLAAFTHAEPLSAHRRALIAEAFQCSVHETYGVVETVAAASECPAGWLHQWPEVGHIEVWDQDGPVRDGRAGQLICTGLLNVDMPLIRYRVGDRGRFEPASRACCCGRTLPLLAIEGRTTDRVPAADERRLEQTPAMASTAPRTARARTRPPLPTVLVLDGHTNQALACVRSLGRAGYPVLVASHRRRPLAAWSRHAGGRFRLQDHTIAAFAELRAWAHHRGAHIVLPLTERACMLCNAEADAWNALNIIVGCGPDEMLLRAFDKAWTLERAAACGINAPRTRFPTSLAGYHAAVDELGFPCVIKPRFSNARHGAGFLPDLGTAYAHRHEDIEQAVHARRQGEHWPLIQQYVHGTGKGVFALCDRGRIVAWFAHQRLRDVRPSGSGSSLRRSVPLDPRLRVPSERLLADLAWHGPVMLEFRDDGINPPWLIEVNGRFWGSLQLAIAAGADFPVQWIRILSGEPVTPGSSYRHGLTLRWLWGDFKRLLHIMKGKPKGYPGPYPSVREACFELFGRQPAGTRLEVWDPADPWPAVAEWLQGISEVLDWAGWTVRRRRLSP